MGSVFLKTFFKKEQEKQESLYFPNAVFIPFILYIWHKHLFLRKHLTLIIKPILTNMRDIFFLTISSFSLVKACHSPEIGKYQIESQMSQCLYRELGLSFDRGGLLGQLRSTFWLQSIGTNLLCDLAVDTPIWIQFFFPKSHFFLKHFGGKLNIKIHGQIFFPIKLSSLPYLKSKVGDKKKKRKRKTYTKNCWAKNCEQEAGFLVVFLYLQMSDW